MAALAIGIAACATTGSTPSSMPTGPNSSVAASLAVVAEARNLLTIGLQDGKATKASATSLRAQLVTARTVIDTAQPLLKTDPASGAAQLAAVRVGLDALRAYLLTFAGPPPTAAVQVANTRAVAAKLSPTDVTNILAALDAIDSVIQNYAQWKLATSQAVAQGRDMTDVEVQIIRTLDDQADAALVAAIGAK